MRNNILSAVVSGFLILGSSLALAEEPTTSGQDLGKAGMQVQQGPPILSFEQRLSLKPLSDEELAEITAGGLGPVMPFPFQPFLFLPFAFPTHDFLTLGPPRNPQFQNNFQFQGFNVRVPTPIAGLR